MKLKSILIPTDNPIKLGSVCKNPTFGLGIIINKHGEDCFYNTHKSGGSITTPWKRNLKGKLTNYDIILIDTETGIVEGDTFYNSFNGVIGISQLKKWVKDKISFKIISSTDKSHEIITKNVDGLGNDLHEPLFQLSPQSIQLLINYYNEHKCMPESVEVEEDIVGMTDGWIPSYNDPDNSGLSLPSEPIYGIKLNQQGEIEITIPKTEEKSYTKKDLIQASEAELYSKFNSIPELRYRLYPDKT